MNKTWFISDTHFGHTNIIKYCNRPFEHSFEMDECIKDNWNSLVNKEDIVIHLGDVYFKNYAILEELNGSKHLLLGNHDYKNKRILNRYFKVFDDLIVIDRDKKLVMCHYPIKEWPHKYHGYTHIHGHSHGNVDGYDLNAVDVGVDCWNFKPILLDDIHQKVKQRKVKQITDKEE